LSFTVVLQIYGCTTFFEKWYLFEKNSYFVEDFAIEEEYRWR